MAKDKKLKVPKRVAGVKVPKKLRKRANKALAIAENPAAHKLAVAALTAAAASLAKPPKDDDGAGSAGSETNLEAVKEIVRQLRLRDLGGIIVLDLIDMEEKKNRQKVFQEVEKELRKDRSPSKPLQVSDFGLVIITRKRVKQSIERQLTDPCPYCSGSGSIKSASTICYEILTEMKKIGSELEGQGVILRVNPDIARALKEEESALLRDLQQTLGKPVTIKPDTHLHHEQFDVMMT